MMLYDVMYRFPNGELLASFDPAVPGSYVDRFLGRESDCYVCARNINADGHYRYIDIHGREVAEHQLPWVIAEHEAAREREHARNIALIQEGEQLLRAKRVQILEVTEEAARIHIEDRPAEWVTHDAIDAAARQQDTRDKLVPFYRALRNRIRSMGRR